MIVLVTYILCYTFKEYFTRILFIDGKRLLATWYITAGNLDIEIMFHFHVTSGYHKLLSNKVPTSSHMVQPPCNR